MDPPELSVAEYAAHWLADVRHRIRGSTLEGYERHVRLHIVPGPLGAAPLVTLDRRAIRAFLVAELNRSHGRRYVRSCLYVLSGILDLAVDEGLVPGNVARGAGLRLFRRARENDGVRKAMSRTELSAFLDAVRLVRWRQRDYFLTLARAGLRPGEALGLQWSDFDGERRVLRVARSWDTKVGPTKSGRVRFVDLSAQLCAALTDRRTREPHTTWIFQSTQRVKPWDRSHVEKAMRAGLELAGLPLHFHPHSLRHTYASLLIEAGWPIQYCQQQLGHSSIAMTVDVYGSAWRSRNLPAVDSLDDAPREAHGPLHAVPRRHSAHRVA